MTPETPSHFAPPPQPRADRRATALALGTLVVGLGVLVFVLTGAWRSWQGAGAVSAVPPPPTVLSGTPIAAYRALSSTPGTIVSPAPSPAQARQQSRLAHGGSVRVPARWEAGFYAIYAAAQRTFAVNWLLLASIHKQETAFSTAPSTYHGLNFAHCCGGPMQFNVHNGPVTTWRLVMNAYRFGSRPPSYNHPTASHPSIYDDFDAIMAAAWLLSSDGARMSLDGTAWQAAYDYYGHDATGVSYADQVLARAIGWSQTGFCANCDVSANLVAAVHAAYGVAAEMQLNAAAAAAARAAKARPRARLAQAPARSVPPRAVAARAPRAHQR